MPKAVIKLQALTSCASISLLTADGLGGLSDLLRITHGI